MTDRATGFLRARGGAAEDEPGCASVSAACSGISRWPKPERHRDFIEMEGFPACWQRKKGTVEIEAKSEEVAVLKLKKELEQQEERRASKITQNRS